MIIEKSHYFHFRLFDTRELGALSLMLAIVYFGEGLISIFIPVYFWNLGFPVWKILGFYLLNAIYFIVFTITFLPIIRRMSDKIMTAISIPFLIGYFLLLSGIEQYTWFFWLAPAFLAFHMLFLNIGYNLDFACATKKGREGHDVGIRYLTGSLSQFLSPLFGGILIASFGFHVSFFVAVFIFFFSIIPLFFVQKRKIATHMSVIELFRSLSSDNKYFNISSIGYASEIMVGKVLWPIFIFLMVQSTEELGGMVSIGLLFGALVTYLSGLFFDKGRVKILLIGSAGLYSLMWFIRMFIKGAEVIFGSHVIGSAINSGLMVTWASEYYARAHNAENPSMFILSREILYQITRIFFLPILMVLSLFIPLEFFFPICFAIAGLMTIFFTFATKVESSKVRA
ncbi:MAG: MFS transporter [Candidatus Paceibacterota bacterium]|jgi:MFS family permease